MEHPEAGKPFLSKVYKHYFNDATLSDLTIRLSDRTVHAHRIVLCRHSEYFAKMLTGRFQETESKEVELHDDDPEAMTALLRFIYDLPYQADATKQWTGSLKPHAGVYVVADKYCIGALKSLVCEEMQKIVKSSDYLETLKTSEDGFDERLKYKSDFINALKIIYAGTMTEDNQGRKVVFDYLIHNIDFLRKEEEFLSLLRESPGLGTEILGDPDLACEAYGFWSCDNIACAEGVPSCSKCRRPFQAPCLNRYRYEELWKCPYRCGTNGCAVCKNCKTKVTWQQWPDSD